MIQKFAWSIVIASCLLLRLAAQQTIKHPREIVGQELGENNKVPMWDKIVEYFRYLDGVSDRVEVEQLGLTSLKNPFVLVKISSPGNLKNQEEYRGIMQRLSDPRGLSEQEAQTLVRRGKNIVVITCAVDADEVGSPQSAMLFAYTLATANTPEAREILDNTILLLVPSLNPDGLILISKWVAKTTGTIAEGREPDEPHFFYGENNRDWFVFVHPETRMTVEKIFNAWRPPIVYDMHQMGATLGVGVRMWVPPFFEPNEPNVHPMVIQRTNELGMFLASTLIEMGKPGVAFYSIYDAWNPMRQYAPLHNSVRILSEAATPNLATDARVRPEQIRPQLNVDVSKKTWNNPIPWNGGDWSIRNVIEYEQPLMMGVMRHAAEHRERWLKGHLEIHRESVNYKGRPSAFVVPAAQRDPSASAEMLNALIFAGVEVMRASAPFKADNVDYPAGTYVLPLTQPYGRYLKSLMEKKSYTPAMDTGGPIAPYDSVGFTLPVQMGVEYAQADSPFEARLTKVTAVKPPEGLVSGGSGRSGYLIPRESNAAIKLATRLMRDRIPVFWIRKPVQIRGVTFPSGTLFAPAAAGLAARVEAAAKELGINVTAAEEAINVPVQQLKLARIAVYRSYVRERYDESGAYFKLFDEYGFDWKEIVDGDIRQGNLKDRFDVIILPPILRADTLRNGHRPGTFLPDETGGIGQQGARNLKVFVDAGGTLIANDQTSQFAIEEFNLPVKDVSRGIPEKQFAVPGSLVKILGNSEHPISFGMPSEFAAMQFRNPVFEVTGTGPEVAATYPSTNPLISGWITGAETLANRAAIVDAPVGKGHVILLGIRPEYRLQARGTYKLLFNAILYGSAAPVSVRESR